MKLLPDRDPTPFNFPRGYGAASIPPTDDKNRPLSSIWWTKEDVLAKQELEHKPGKLFLGRVDQKPIGLRDNRHFMTIAGTRGGKSSCLLIPNLMMYEGSALVIDPKGELASATARHRKDVLGHNVHVLDPWNVAKLPDDFCPSYDPLAELLEDRVNLIDNADLIADALIIPSGNDPHWSDAARALLRALILWLAINPEASGGSLADLPKLIARLAAEKLGREGDDESLLELLAGVDPAARPEADRDAWEIIRNQAAMMIGTSERERASIFSSARTQLTFLESPAMAAKLRPSHVRLADLKRYPTTIYLCLPASRMATHHRWLRLILNLAAVTMEATPTRKNDDDSDVDPVLFVLEEFAALGAMQTLEKAVAYMGGFGVKLWIVLQDLTQLKRHYPEGWETFLGNAGCLQAFSVSDLTTCEYLSKKLGETTFQITNKVDVNADQALKGDTGLRREFKTAPLLSPDELAIQLTRKPDGKGGSAGGLALVLVSGSYPFVVDRVHHDELQT